MPYLAEYHCPECHHAFTVEQGAFGCAPGTIADPDTPCGRSQRRYRCAQCVRNPVCPACGHLWVKWLNYEALAAKSFDE